MRLAELTSPEVEELCARERVLGLVALGALEQHGPHLPLGTDSLLAEATIDRLADALVEPVLAAPVVPVGVSRHHLAFAGSASLDDDTLLGVTRALLDALLGAGAAGVAVFSTHGGNIPALAQLEETERVKAFTERSRYFDAAQDALRELGVAVSDSDAHAGAVETSQALTAFPELVRPFDGVTGYTAAEEGWRERMREHGIQTLDPDGVLGDPRRASADAGERVFDVVVDALAGWICEELPFTRR